MGLEDKTLNFSSGQSPILASIDPFHFENAINNVIDNAVKYGGSDISIEVKNTPHDIVSVLISG